MALVIHTSSSLAANKLYPHFHRPIQFKSTTISIKFQQDSSTEEATTSDSGTASKKSGDSQSGLGFGSSAAPSTEAPTKKKGGKGKRDRSSIIRRKPVEKPSFVTPQEAARAEELKKNESAFLLAWLGLGAIILLQGIALAASGFLPEAWDDFFVKYLYPSFTPTVFLFVAGTVGYGVLKYLEDEKSNKEN